MQKEKYTIRDATENDAETIVKMHAQSWLDTYPNDDANVSNEWVKEYTSSWFTEERLANRRERIKQALSSPDMMYKIAIDKQGTVIGIICPFRNENEQRVGAIYVDKSYQGSGLAQELMGEIIKWADPKRSLELEVVSYNERAKAFYRKYGFEEVEGSANTHKSKLPVIKMIRRGDKQ